MKKKYIVRFVLVVLLVWLSATTTIQRFKAPHLTETQLFLNIPNSCILKFK